MKKILITGSNGFIGSHLCDYYSDLNFSVTGVDMFSPTRELKYNFIRVDLGNDDINKLLYLIDPDIIIHCAGSADVGNSIKYPFNDFSGNTILLHKFLFSMHECNLRKCRFVFLSSAAVYGEPQGLPIYEETGLNPLSPYALHKKLCEDICLFFNKNYRFNIKIARVFSAYGPGLKKQIFWDMHKKISNTKYLNMFGTGNESRDYIYIDDLVRALYLISIDDDSKNATFNVANGEEIKIDEIAHIFANENDFPLSKVIFDGNNREGDPLNWRADITKLLKLGYEKKIDIKTGICQYIKWIKDNNL